MLLSVHNFVVVRTRLRALLVIASLGFASSLIAHIALWFDTRGAAIYILLLASIWLPITFITVASITVPIYSSNGSWQGAKIVKQGCPRWLNWTNLSLNIYFGLHMVYILYNGFVLIEPNMPRAFARMLTAFLISAYFDHSNIFYSAYAIRRIDQTRSCPQGHEMPYLAKYCERCGMEMGKVV